MRLKDNIYQNAILLLLVLVGTLLVTLGLEIKEYRYVKAQAAAYQSLYYTAIKITDSLQEISGKLQANNEDLIVAYRLSERKAEILSLAQRILKTSERRCNLDPDRAYNLAVTFIDIGAKEGVPGELLAAVGNRESCFRQSARGKAGEIGMMQIKPTTAMLYGFDPRLLKSTYSNISIAAHILAIELTKYPPKKALLVYNQGHPFDVGNTYGNRVLATYRELGGE